METDNLRWFIKTGGSVDLTKGFSTKQNANEWIYTHPDFNWRAGWTFRLYGDHEDRTIVNKKGIKPKN